MSSSPPFSNIQMELLKIYSTNISEEELLELKKHLATFFAQKAIKLADNLWDERNLTNAEMESWANGEG